ncbi:hypothetical protein [Lolliginicoccus suaedae]|uniref:hypothetical protein n=1 Tax=Lolliginicoccus suaedae TaxID=2605429 RepID=UPI0011F03441|nr:hypothetical protein [Lolliginicoccus suaedae]
MKSIRRQKILDLSAIGIVVIGLGLGALISDESEAAGKYWLACAVVAGIGVLVLAGQRLAPERFVRRWVRGAIGVIVVGAVIAIAPLLHRSGDPAFGIPLVLVAAGILAIGVAAPAHGSGPAVFRAGPGSRESAD